MFDLRQSASSLALSGRLVTALRVLLVGVLLAVSSPHSASGAETAETWLFSGSTEGWTASTGTSVTSTSGTNLHVVFATGGGIYTPVINYIPGSDTFHRDYIRFGYRITTGSFTQLKFNFSTLTRANFSSPDFFLTGLIKDGGWHYLTFRVDNLGDWKTASRITQLRLVAVVAGGGGASGTMDFDFFALREDDKLPQTYTCDRGTNILSVSPSGWTNGPITVSVNANDPGPYLFAECGPTPPDRYGAGVGSFRYTVNGVTSTVPFDDQDGQWPTGWSASSITIPAGSIPSGAHSFTVWALDRVGFQATTHPSTTVYYDGTPPGAPVITSIAPYGVTTAPNGYEIHWTVPTEAHSGLAGYEYFFDGTDGPYDVPTNAVAGITPASNGHHTFQVRAIDNAGNVGPLSNAVEIWWDNEPPSTPTVTQVTPSGWTATNSFAFTWTNATDNYLGIGRYAYLIDGSSGPVNLGASPSVSGVLAPGPGPHTFQVRAEDPVGNAGDWSDPVEFRFDNVAPTLPGPPVASPASWTNTNAFSMTWPTATDAHSGIAGYQYSVNGGPATPAAGTNISGALAAIVGMNTISVRAIDLAGNPSTWAADSIYYNPAYIPAPVVQSPVNGASVALPEVFSWVPVANATGYEVQIARGGNFAGDVWTTQTTQGSLVVPQLAAPLSGSHAWRVRSLGSEPPSEWGPAQTFLRVTSVSLPAAVALLQPASGVSLPAGEALFQWGSVNGATSYKLELSRDTQFTPGIGTWEQNDVTATHSLVSLPDGADRVYWRVTAKNAQGYGPRSSTWYVDIVPPAPSLSAVALLVPSQDLAVEQGMALLADGLVVGRPTGPVTVEWIWDDEVLATETVACNGAGFKPTPIELPTAEVGPHTVRLRVTGPNVLQSVTRIVDVQAPGFGPAVKLVLVADQSHILPESTTVFYCTVRDSNDAIVLSDTGRPLAFSLTSGEGSLTALSALTDAGVATTSYVAPAFESSPVIQVSDAAPSAGMQAASVPLRGGMSPAFVCTSRFDVERNLALAYLARLEGLSNVGLRWAVYDPSWPHFDVDYARGFVLGTHPGDEARLHRLNIFLRYIDRAYFYNPDFDKIGPKETGNIAGAASMFVDYANTSGIAVLEVVDGASDLLEVIPRLRRVNAAVAIAVEAAIKSGSRKLLDAAHSAAEKAIDKKIKDPVRRNEMKSELEYLFQFASLRIDYSHQGSGYLLLGDFALTTTLAEGLTKKRFVAPMQNQLNRVVWELRQPSWNGGSDGSAEYVTRLALNEVRRQTNAHHTDVVTTLDRYGNILVEIATASGKTLAKLSEGLVGSFLASFLKLLAVFVFNVAKAAIIYATGFDALSVAVGIQHQADVVAGACIAYGGAAAPLVAESRPMLRLEATPTAAAQTTSAPISGSFAAAASAGVSDAMNGYEDAARAVERSIFDGDPFTAADLMGALAEADAQLENSLRLVTSPLQAVGDSAELSVLAFEERRDSVDSALLAASMNRLIARAATLDWLTDPSNDSLLADAVGSIHTGIDSTRLTAREAVALASATIGENAPAFLSLDAPQVPDYDVQGDTTVIRVTVRNLGGAVATGARVRLSAQPEFEFQSNEVQDLGDLAPGAVGTAHWVLRLIPTMTAADSMRILSFSVFPDSGSAGTSAAGAIEVLFSPAVLGVEPGPQRAIRPMAMPNPSHGVVAIRFTLPERGPVSLQVFDLAGRRIRQIDHPGMSPGLHDLAWDGRTSTGEMARPGVYLAKLTMLGRPNTMRIVRIR